MTEKSGECTCPEIENFLYFAKLAIMGIESVKLCVYIYTHNHKTTIFSWKTVLWQLLLSDDILRIQNNAAGAGSRETNWGEWVRKWKDVQIPIPEQNQESMHLFARVCI